MFNLKTMKYNKNLRITLLFLFCSTILLAQKESGAVNPTKNSVFDIGISVGYEGGGLIGLKATVQPIHNIQLFVGYSYLNANTSQTGTAYGLKIFPFKHTSKNINPYLLGMYGTNAVVNISNATYLNKSFNGFSFGVGCNINESEDKNLFKFMNHSSFWGRFYSSFSLYALLPNSDVDSYRNYLSNTYNITTGKPFPIGASLGINFRLF